MHTRTVSDYTTGSTRGLLILIILLRKFGSSFIDHMLQL